MRGLHAHTAALPLVGVTALVQSSTEDHEHIEAIEFAIPIPAEDQVRNGVWDR